MDPISLLHERSRSFGPAAAREKLRLLASIHPSADLGKRRLALLRGTLDFMRAYPDNAGVLARVREVRAALPLAEPHHYAYSYGNVRRLVRRQPDAIEIDWQALDDEAPLIATLDLVISPGEALGLEDPRVSLRDWFARCRPGWMRGDLEFVVAALEQSGLSARVQTNLYDRLDLPLVYRSPDALAIEWPGTRTHYQRHEIDRRSFPLAPAIRRPIAPPRRVAPELIDVATLALCARNLEIYPLVNADPRDVRRADCGGGLSIAFVGVSPEFRSPLETLWFFLVLKNGVPIAYGPSGVFLGCCEMGINLFPEFRGGEIRRIYAGLMRVLHHWLGVENFFLTRYGMGEDNPDAIESGAFWFYRKLGFRATNHAVEALAREEETRMAARPGYRSDRRMLHRLSHTEASFDLSDGRCRPFDFGALGMEQGGLIAERFGGDRRAADDRCAARAARLLGLPAAGRALRALAPMLALIPDLARWSPAERAALARLVRAKDAMSEARAARLSKTHARLERSLRAAGERGHTGSSRTRGSAGARLDLTRMRGT